MKPTLIEDFLNEFVDALKAQLANDNKRWGDTWLKRGLRGQEKRTFERFRDYYDQFKLGGNPVPWMKVIGGALICWVRENHPEILTNADDSCENISI